MTRCNWYRRSANARALLSSLRSSAFCDESPSAHRGLGTGSTYLPCTPTCLVPPPSCVSLGLFLVINVFPDRGRAVKCWCGGFVEATFRHNLGPAAVSRVAGGMRRLGFRSSEVSARSRGVSLSRPRRGRPPPCTGAPRPILPLLRTQVSPGRPLTSPWAEAPPDAMSYPMPLIARRDGPTRGGGQKEEGRENAPGACSCRDAGIRGWFSPSLPPLSVLGTRSPGGAPVHHE